MAYRGLCWLNGEVMGDGVGGDGRGVGGVGGLADGVWLEQG